MIFDFVGKKINFEPKTIKVCHYFYKLQRNTFKSNTFKLSIINTKK